MNGNNSIGIGEAAALITILTAAVYLLGLVSLGWSIFARITNDTFTTLYALALVPRTVVAGHGIRTFVGFPLLLTPAALLLLWVGVQKLWQILEGAINAALLDNTGVPHPPRIIALLAILLVIVTGIVLIVVVFSIANLLYQKLPLEKLFDIKDDRTMSTISFIVVVVACLAAKERLDAAFVFAPNEILPHVNWAQVTGTSILLFIVIAIGIMPLALSEDPPLPAVEIVQPNHSIVGKLVGHTEGTWHLFDEQGRLVSVPNDKTNQVQVYKSVFDKEIPPSARWRRKARLRRSARRR